MDGDGTVPDAELFEYYKARVEAFDTDRAAFAAKVRDLAIPHEEMHRLRWEIRSREAEVAELQRAVRDAQVYLYDERETALRLQSENEALKLGDIENRRRVQHLLALTQPVGRDTTFFQPAEGRSVAASAPGSRSTASRSAPGAAAPRHPPSAVPPSGWDDAAAEGAASARAAAAESHLRAAHALLEERGEAWRREREDAEEEARAAREAARGREEALESELRRERAKSRATAEELIRVRAGAQQSETRMREEACALRRGLERLEAKHESAVRAASSELSAVRQSADEEAERLVADAAASAEGREADAASMRSEFAAVRRLYADKLASAEARGKDLEGRLRKLERRRALDLEGFGADVSALRRALEQLETQWALVGATAADMAARDGDPSGLASAIRMGEGMVKLGTHILTGESVAVKVLEKARIKEIADVTRVTREIKIFKMVEHPFVCRLYEVCNTKHHILLVSEFASDGELFSYIVKHGRLREAVAARLFAQLLEGVDYLHDCGVVHRDLKPENILLVDKAAPDGGLAVKVIDFGLSNTFKEGATLTTACGSPAYASPEMILRVKGGYDPRKSDVWSLGVVLFAMVAGCLPFEHDNTAALYDQILNARYRCPSHLSPACKDLLGRILVVDPTRRFGAAEIRRHPWLRSASGALSVVRRPLRQQHLAEAKEAGDAQRARSLLSMHSPRSASELLPAVVRAVEGLGVSRQQLVDTVSTRGHNAATAAYFLLLRKALRRGDALSLLADFGDTGPLAPASADAEGVITKQRNFFCVGAAGRDQDARSGPVWFSEQPWAGG